MNNDVIQLRIDGTLKATDDTSVPEWPAEVYELDGLARGPDRRIRPKAVEADAVLELELTNGIRILVAAEDAGRYLNASVGRGDSSANGNSESGIGETGIEVGRFLQLSAVRTPSATSRDGLGAWTLRGLRIYRQGPAAVTALIAAGTYQDAQLEDRNGLYRWTGDAAGFTRVEQLPDLLERKLAEPELAERKSAEPVLIFIHGTGSSSQGSFGSLWSNQQYRQQLVATYGPRIFALEHRSLTESPIANALDLVRALPQGARVHLVSHSRGGMVGELLARTNRLGQEPFTDAEIERFLAHGKRRGRTGFEADAKRLGELNRELINRAIVVERFVRVACPARGTTLASGRLDRWASVMLNLLGKGFDAAGNVVPGAAPAIVGYSLFKRFLLAVVKQRTDATILPGLEAMMPDSPLVDLLNGPDVTIEQPLHVLAGDFEGEGLLPWLGDCLSEVFYGGETDLVVNTPSMAGGAVRSQGIRQKTLSGPEVTHFSYFERDESALALLAALRGDDTLFELLHGPSRVEISRGGKKPKLKAGAPIVFLLPGIMGSHLQLGRSRIWFNPLSMWLGRMARLKLKPEGGSVDHGAVDASIGPDGWMDINYEKLARYLADSHEVRPFAYDWRLSITEAAQRLGGEIDQAMIDAKERGQALRIVAHSMGGLVARLALQGRWQQFKSIPGSRLLQLGTPNQGSHSIAAVLMARDDFVQTIERWFDWKHDMREFLEIVRDFPGVLELLPWPGENGKAMDGVDYFDPAVWQSWFDQDGDPKKARSWAPPQKAPLAKAKAAITALRGAALDPECTLYVAGRASTPSAVRIVDGVVEIGWIEEGDGRVPWKTGIPPAVPVWYTDAVHGDLANHEKAFDAYRQLIETGDTRDTVLTRLPPSVRGTSVGGESIPVFRPRSLEGNGLYPSADEVVAAATGGSRPGTRPAVQKEPPALVEVVHGSLASAESPVLIGAYANDSLRGTASFLDGHLGGQLLRTHGLGRYPAQTDDAMVFLNPERGGKPAGAIVVGLGALGDLMPGNLTRALANGLLEYARIHEQAHPHSDPDADSLAVSTLLVGTGFTGLTVEVGVRCLLDALRSANDALRRSGAKTRIGRLTIYEETEDRAVTAVQVLRDLQGDSHFADAVRFDGRLRPGAGGYRGRCIASGGEPGTYRVHIVAGEKGGLCFTVITNRARNEVAVEADQRQAVDGLIASITGATRDQPGLSRALFELMLPNSMKGAIAEVRTLMMSIDPVAGAYPWELMRDSDLTSEAPLATRVELVRQLASSHGRGRVPTVTDSRVFIVGDTRSGMSELPGAQAEARAVAKAFIGQGYDIHSLYRASAQEVFEALFNGRYRFMHLAGHGVVREGESGLTGMVLGPDTYLTTAQINKLRHVPEFVFLNCCHLGAMADDSQPRWGELAANLATQFIEMGCKAVIAAGWAVDDSAADTFAQTFYGAMLAGKRFGQAVLQARTAAWKQHPFSNTWGAFQAYGDERYSFPVSDIDAGRTGQGVGYYVHASHLVADLDMLCARLQSASESEQNNYYRPQVQAIEQAALSAHLQSTCVREKLACAWAELGDMERAIDHFRAALVMDDAGFGLNSLEQLANLESRYGARLLATADGKQKVNGEKYMKAGLERLRLLIKIAPTVERLALLGSHWKRRAQVCYAEDIRSQAPAGKALAKKASAKKASAKKTSRQTLDESLKQMREAYWSAAQQAYQRSGQWDYYPLFNALDADILLAACGDSGGVDAQSGQFASLLQAGIENARRRFADNRGFFHALAEVEARRINALWACYDGRPAAACITQAAVLNGLAASYCDVLRRLGSSREEDSVINHLHFLAEMLPADSVGNKVKAALGQLQEAIRQGLAR